MNIRTLTKDIEQVSKNYTSKFNIERDEDWYVLKLQEEMGELIQSYLMMTKKARSKGKSEQEIQEDFNKEMADVFCHLLLLANFYKVDINKFVREKWLVWNK